MAINLSSAFHTTRLALPAMKAANWGRIINVASVHGLVASAQKAAYVAAKHGSGGPDQGGGAGDATTGVTCNAICPGWVLTPLVQKQVDAKAAAQGISNEEATRQLLGEKSRRCSSPHPKNWPSWPCSSAPAPPTTCVAWPGTWMAAGQPSKNLSGNYLMPQNNLRTSSKPSAGLQRICTEPDTVTSTVLLPASTGSGLSAMDAILASMAIMRGRGTGICPWLLTDTSRNV
jgi:hypothetical protein